MKQPIYVCLLAMCATAAAQTPAPQARAAGSAQEAELERNLEARLAADAARRESDDEKIRAKLEQARSRLDQAAREVAELSTQLGHEHRRGMRFIEGEGGRRAVLGVQIDPASGKEGARVRAVSPGGAAEEAGIEAGDVIVALDGRAVAGGEEAGRALVERMREARPEHKMKVRILRAGKNQELMVIPRSRAFEMRTFDFRGPDMEGAIAGARAAMPVLRQFRGFWPGDFAGLELASLTPALGAYFGTADGVLVVQSPESDAFKLQDGDVIQSIDGRKPDDGAHALRILRSYQTGEKLSLQVLRQRKPVTLSITMPERAEAPDHLFHSPPIPPAAGSGTFE